jgi:hypothetical protein
VLCQHVDQHEVFNRGVASILTEINAALKRIESKLDG